MAYVTSALERVVFGELHLVRRRLDATLDEIGAILRQTVRIEAWEETERAARIAFRAIDCAIAAVPSHADTGRPTGLARVGPLRLDLEARMQWWEGCELALSPLLHDLLARFASEPKRCHSAQDLLRGVWWPLGRPNARPDAVSMAVSRLRRELISLGADPGEWLVKKYGAGWVLQARKGR